MGRMKIHSLRSKNKEIKKLKKGKMVSQSLDEISVITWKDTRDVCVITK